MAISRSISTTISVRVYEVTTSKLRQKLTNRRSCDSSDSKHIYVVTAADTTS